MARTQVTLIKDAEINGIKHTKGEKPFVTCAIAKKLLDAGKIKKPKGN